MRELTRPDFKLTKRGSGRPLAPRVISWLTGAARASSDTEGACSSMAVTRIAPSPLRGDAKADTVLSPATFESRAARLFLCHRLPRLVHGNEKPASLREFRSTWLTRSQRSRQRGAHGRQEEASRRHHAQAARPCRDAHARAVRCAPGPRRS